MIHLNTTMLYKVTPKLISMLTVKTTLQIERNVANSTYTENNQPNSIHHEYKLKGKHIKQTLNKANVG